MNKYKEELISNASKLDAITNYNGEITKQAMAVIEKRDKLATIKLIQYLVAVTESATREVKLLGSIVHDKLIAFLGYAALEDITNKVKEDVDDSRTLQDLLDELHALVGLEAVKRKVQDLIMYQKVQQLRQEHHLQTTKNTLHLAFTGNPGTGKTTVARIVGRIYKRIGLLSKGHFIEVSRTDLIAGYQGQTALKVKEVIDRAKGGVLFIDEAYSITENDHSDSYGRECLTELTKALEDYRDDLVVIVAGYTEPMKKFFDSNPGLKSRFNTFIEFDDYNADELEKILVSMCEQNDYILTKEAKERIHVYFEQQTENKNDNFANGRLVRNLYDDLVMNHARRVIHMSVQDRFTLSEIISEDCNFNDWVGCANSILEKR